MHAHIFKPSVEKYLSKLDSNVRSIIIKKLEFYLSQENPFRFADTIRDDKAGEYRFRMGDYRAVFDFEDGVILINLIDRRDKIYK